jgi:hypothetical protein
MEDVQPQAPLCKDRGDYLVAYAIVLAQHSQISPSVLLRVSRKLVVESLEKGHHPKRVNSDV